MSSNIQEDMMIIINKKTREQILEKRIRLKIYQKVNRWMEYNHSTIFFPLYNNERYIYDNKIRYGLDKNDKIILIQIEDMNNSYKDIAYIFYSKDEYQYTDGINYKTDNDKVVIYYDSLYEICEDQTIVLYSSKLDSNDNNENTYDELKSIIDIIYNELISIKLNEKINVTKDFIITEPFLYD